MTRPRLEVADVFRRHSPAWRAANEGHLSLAQRRVMRAVELCRTAELGGHVERCADCAHDARGLQLLPRPALPQVPVEGGAGLAGGTRGGAPAGPLLPRGV